MASAGAALLAGFLTACGGPPEDAEKQDFCEVIEGIENFEEFDEAVELYEELESIGTPEDIGEVAREGFEITVETVLAADDRDDVEQAYEDLSAGDKDRVDAFSEYARETCLEDEPAAEVT